MKLYHIYVDLIVNTTAWEKHADQNVPFRERGEQRRRVKCNFLKVKSTPSLSEENLSLDHNFCCTFPTFHPFTIILSLNVDFIFPECP